MFCAGHPQPNNQVITGVFACFLKRCLDLQEIPVVPEALSTPVPRRRDVLRGQAWSWQLHSAGCGFGLVFLCCLWWAVHRPGRQKTGWFRLGFGDEKKEQAPTKAPLEHLIPSNYSPTSTGAFFLVISKGSLLWALTSHGRWILEPCTRLGSSGRFRLWGTSGGSLHRRGVPGFCGGNLDGENTYNWGVVGVLGHVGVWNGFWGVSA